MSGPHTFSDSPAEPRRRTQVRMSLRAVLEAGFGAGMIFLLLELLATAFGAETPLGPASITLREVLRVETGPMSSGLAVAVLLVHFTLSFCTTLALAVFIHRWGVRLSVAAGFVYGLFLYAVNFILFALVLPGLAAAGDGVAMFNYVIYGGAAAWIYSVRQPAGVDHTAPSRTVVALLVVFAFALSFLVGYQVLGL